jgi:NAD(P)-dependent dehydrogenase (short-subunit alcohol dehydrogenase family)
MGHFLLTSLLLDRIKSSAPARIVVVASTAHRQAKGIDFATLRQRTASITGLPEYAVAKLSNVLFASELARRIEGSGVTNYSLHPGVVGSDVWRGLPWPLPSLVKPFMLSNEEGAATTLYCATSPECESQTGLYYDKCQVVSPSRVARDAGLAQTLWEKSEAWIRE